MEGVAERILPVTAVDFCYGWSLWVYLTWLPSFLAQQYNLPLAQFVWFSSGILLAGVVGDTLGGVMSDAILHRTGDLKLARRLNLVIGLLGSFVFLLPCLFVHDLLAVAILLSLAFFFLELTNAVLWALSMDLAPQYAGIAGGVMNTGFGVAGISLRPCSAYFCSLREAGRYLSQPQLRCCSWASSSRCALTRLTLFPLFEVDPPSWSPSGFRRRSTPCPRHARLTRRHSGVKGLIWSTPGEIDRALS